MVHSVKKQSPKLVDNLVDETHPSRLGSIFSLRFEELPIF